MTPRGPGRRPATRRATWSARVGAFEREELSRAFIGEGWRRRIAYEVRRTPILLRDVPDLPRLTTPGRLRRQHLDALRRTVGWSPTTLALHLVALRRFARWAGNPLAQESRAWAVPAGTPSHRRWLDRREFAELYRGSVGLERVLISLEGLNGLRRVEVLRLRARDVDLSAHRLRVLGKGRNGGKWRTVPLFPETERTLSYLVADAPGDAPLVPRSRSGADALLGRAVARSSLAERGVRVSHHDLRRTFGRLAYGAGMDLVQLKNLYGHASLDQTVHYVGLDEDRMREGLASLARVMRPLLASARSAGALDPSRGRAPATG